MVMMIAVTPSLNASSLLLPIQTSLSFADRQAVALGIKIPAESRCRSILDNPFKIYEFLVQNPHLLPVQPQKNESAKARPVSIWKLLMRHLQFPIRKGHAGFQIFR
jgi:hypothetical protein